MNKSLKDSIYLDNNATTALDPKVAEVMQQELFSAPGNPSSIHAYGREVRNKVTIARRQIAQALDVHPQEIIFTSGGTESMNLLLNGLIDSSSSIITSSVEHSCVFSPLKRLAEQGQPVAFLNPDESGSISVNQIESAITPSTKAIVLMAANNETGVLTDLESIAALAFERKISFIVDGVSLLGKMHFHIPQGVTAMGFSAHKFHGPKGSGFAFLRSPTQINPLILGGGQENNHRGGTENVIGILGMAKAVTLLDQELDIHQDRIESLRDWFESEVIKNVPNTIVNGTGPRIPNTSNISFLDIEGETLLMKLDLAGVAASHGSACSTGALEPSRVLMNMGLHPNRADSAVRFSLSKNTTKEDLKKVIHHLVKFSSEL